MSPSSFIPKVLRRLKARWGRPLILINVERSGINAVSGEQTLVKAEHNIKKAIYLPQDTRRDMQYDLAFLATGVNFVHGGLYDRTHQRVIIDAKDLRGFPLEVSTKARLQNSSQECEIKFIDKFNNGEAYVLFIEGVIGVNHATT